MQKKRCVLEIKCLWVIHDVRLVDCVRNDCLGGVVVIAVIEECD